MAYGNFRNLLIRTAAEKVLSDKPFNITENLKFNVVFLQLFITFLTKKLLVILLKVKLCQTKN